MVRLVTETPAEPAQETMTENSTPEVEAAAEETKVK